jgi:hypothetical protein
MTSNLIDEVIVVADELDRHAQFIASPPSIATSIRWSSGGIEGDGDD